MVVSMEDVARRPVVPVIAVESVEAGLGLARALVAGGLDVLEVTMRTPAALDAIAAMRSDLPDAIVGVGTVRTPSDLDAALARGAQFVVTPGTPPRLGDALEAMDVPVLPGCATASEAMALADRGFRTLKLFPAEASGGVAILKGLAGPLADLAFCPTGGVSMANAASYLALSNVVCVGGTWVAPKDAVVTGDWDRITTLASEAAALPRG